MLPVVVRIHFANSAGFHVAHRDLGSADRGSLLVLHLANDRSIQCLRLNTGRVHSQEETNRERETDKFHQLLCDHVRPLHLARLLDAICHVANADTRTPWEIVVKGGALRVSQPHEDRCSKASPQQTLSQKPTPRTGNLGPGLTGGLASSAAEPAPSQRDSPEHRSHFNPAPVDTPQNRTFLLGTD